MPVDPQGRTSQLGFDSIVFGLLQANSQLRSSSWLLRNQLCALCSGERRFLCPGRLACLAPGWLDVDLEFFGGFFLLRVFPVAWSGDSV